ncbi:pyridoxal-phosphate dependent enzyme [Streptomyces sp. 110]|uniref:Pyridoxal-phosphate dependent enzyme n=1 Tax=Streptomyces endocoffeicus TaxID=2898945 RepID=A0ABS1Q638_9ACTN|nr:pyridoxal-phosphate dependent enzyme [Streptomyces endocoffeicus]MBL1120141.1 pyridoxal-phosphate dependent enzyme [Streptomyces endocoffeicus]
MPVNYVAAAPEPDRDVFEAASAADPALGIWRWGPLLPVRPVTPTSLGEGNTPVVRLGGRGRSPHDHQIVLKNESTNPTWSHKDRLCALAVAAAELLGHDAVAAASSGNHGASLAAYAARAGMRCLIATISSVPAAMRTFMEVYGAEVHAFDDFGARYGLIENGGTAGDWYVCSNASSPPVGSPAYGVDGYKTIAYELWEQLPDRHIGAIVIPTGYGDCLSGLARGFADLHAVGLVSRVPKLIAAEVFGKIGHSLRSKSLELGPWPTRPTAAFSIGGGYTTYQTIEALRSTSGDAVSVEEADVLAAQLDLAREYGIYAEASSAIALTAARRVIETGLVEKTDVVVALTTSTGLKDVDTTRASLSATSPAA